MKVSASRAKFSDVGAHLACAERAIEADRHRVCVLDRIPERARRLSRQQASRAVGDGAGDHDRQVDAAFVAHLGDGKNRRFGVERVEDGFDQEKVGAAVDQPAHLLAIGGAQLIERDGAKTGIGHVRRDRRGAVGRPERAGHKAAPAVIFFRQRRRFARERRPGLIKLIGDAFHAVIGLRNRRRGKRIGGDDVGAGAKISEVDVAHGVRTAEIEQVVVAAHFAIPGVETRSAIAFLVELERLDHGAHGTVEHQDALLK